MISPHNANKLVEKIENTLLNFKTRVCFEKIYDYSFETKRQTLGYEESEIPRSQYITKKSSFSTKQKEMNNYEISKYRQDEEPIINHANSQYKKIVKKIRL
jgi:hypothetical protein